MDKKSTKDSGVETLSKDIQTPVSRMNLVFDSLERTHIFALSDSLPYGREESRTLQKVVSQQFKQNLGKVKGDDQISQEFLEKISTYWVLEYLRPYPATKKYRELVETLEQVFVYVNTIAVPCCNWNIAKFRSEVQDFEQELENFEKVLVEIPENSELPKSKMGFLHNKRKSLQESIKSMQRNRSYYNFSLKEKYSMLNRRINAGVERLETYTCNEVDENRQDRPGRSNGDRTIRTDRADRTNRAESVIHQKEKSSESSNRYVPGSLKSKK